MENVRWGVLNEWWKFPTPNRSPPPGTERTWKIRKMLRKFWKIVSWIENVACGVLNDLCKHISFNQPLSQRRPNVGRKISEKSSVESPENVLSGDKSTAPRIPFSGHPKPFKWRCSVIIIKIPVQVPAIETCFMSIDEILVTWILSKSRSPYMRGELNIGLFIIIWQYYYYYHYY